jgi:organic hydroperoxide reductase OsmC/OhrA
MAKSEIHTFGIELEQQEGFEFRVRFDWPDVPELVLDEPEPLGRGRGPNAVRLVGAAVANCLAASLVFCLKSKFRQNPGPVRAMASGRLEKNEHGRYRIAGIDVVLALAESFGDMPHQGRCLEQFEDFCVVTESVRRGIPVAVTVIDALGKVVHETASPTISE